MMIDFGTTCQLELVKSLNVENEKKNATLFGVIDSTLTPMGSRLLRSNILQPLKGKYWFKT